MKRIALLAALAAVAMTASPLLAAEKQPPKQSEKQYDQGATDTEIKIGQTLPWSGPASAYSVEGMVQRAYFDRTNRQGGVNGRKINFISLDDAYSPPKTVEQTRKLVEQEGVLAMFAAIGTAPNIAVHKYLNNKKVPQILILTGASRWNDPKNFPWTMAFYPLYDMEGMIFARHALQAWPNGKIAILSQNDDAGRDYVRGFKEGLGDKGKAMVVAEATYEVTDPTVDSQIVKLKNSGADVFFLMATPKFGAQALKKAHEVAWKPKTLLVSVASSIGGVLKPAGLEASQGVITTATFKTALDPAWDNAPDMKEYIAFMKESGLEKYITDRSASLGYVSAALMERILQRCGDNLTRANIMKQVSSLHDSDLPLLLPGVTVKTTPDNLSPFGAMRLQRFEGEGWVLFGEAISAQH
ncbi:ABC transporter substrate-binding protein [Camelimonas lactis]|uniref:ABC-type branched-subunit amino acid transport system substrate-binding protein n=1 Tax=Camelimonas lactis TaxID=659006 RepID=A0A4R2GU38_9HYPH|nr:ABC transporter substrate-binding protein [Camelimonas lactis]TCO13816.1 ABC-type branched-subunit amino acid transport system substrate-binding protein [Camelimonas lactis]